MTIIWFISLFAEYKLKLSPVKSLCKDTEDVAFCSVTLCAVPVTGLSELESLQIAEIDCCNALKCLGSLDYFFVLFYSRPGRS